MGRPANTVRLELKVPKEIDNIICEVADKIEPGGRNYLGLQLLKAATVMVFNPLRRIVIPEELVQMRKKFHGFPDDPYAADSQPVPPNFGDTAKVEILEAKLKAAELMVENERLKRELAEERLKTVQK